MKWLVELLVTVLEILRVIKDSDNDGTPDLLDKEPENPEVH